MDSEQSEYLMRAAITQARLAEALGDVPIGAVIARGGEIITSAHNRRIIDADPTAHAEMLAIRSAAESIGDWRLTGCSIAVTLEPCPMCAGAIVLARIDRLIYGAADPKAGAVKTLYQICSDDRLNHKVEIISGVLTDECSRLMSDFFQRQRRMGKK
ncbi:MAG: tRNA adenosine(34) deaminase TadA [Planctomycetota bacterium]|nr:tRNA adenosine(34) deaminase TadA [Planctomycetota bacterium]